ncbi:MAG: hypothetical protein N3D11_17190 [Candidatus Sumerlaeia bacterium]|nr:hypothetical protein [Candidatus Sumerlaeia bacterium]
MDRNLAGVCALAALTAISVAVRIPFLAQDNLSPDAADYINIARNIARGRGAVHSIKWHFFTRDPAVHSALGERPLLYPVTLVPFCRGDFPARACQWATVGMSAAAMLLAGAWARRIGISWGATLVAVGLLGFNPGFIACSIYPWSESLYLVWLFGLLLAVGNDAQSRRAGYAAAVLTALAVLTRPSAPAIVLGLSAWWAGNRAFGPLIRYWGLLILLMLPWWGAMAVVRGDPFYSMQRFHLVVGDISEGMAAGYGVEFPGPLQYLAGHFGDVAGKIARQTAVYMEQLFGAHYLSLLSVFAFLPLLFSTTREAEKGNRGGFGPAYLLALFHALLPAMVWATFDPRRFMLPSYALLLFPAAAGLEFAIGRLARRPLRISAWILILGAVGLVYAELLGRVYASVQSRRDIERAMQVARFQVDRVVEREASLATSDPFAANYYFDRPAIILPEFDASDTSLRRLERFLDEYRPNYLLLTREQGAAVGPWVGASRLRYLEEISPTGLRLFSTAPSQP